MAKPEEIRRAREELKALIREYEQLTRKKSPFIDPSDKASLAEIRSATDAVANALESATRKSRGLGTSFSRLQPILQANVAEISKMNNSVNTGKRAYDKLVGVVRELADEERNIGRLTLAQLKKLDVKAKSELESLRNAAEALMIEKNIKNLNATNISAKRNLTKAEKGLLLSAKNKFAFESQAVKATEIRLSLERKVLDNLKLTGGILQGIGNLASSLGLSGFAESISDVSEGLEDKIRVKIRQAAEEKTNEELKAMDASERRQKSLTTREKEILEKLTQKVDIGEDLTEKEQAQLDIISEKNEKFQELVEKNIKFVEGVGTVKAKIEALGEASEKLVEQLSDPAFVIGAMAKGFTELEEKSVAFQRLTGQNAKGLANMNTQLVLGSEVLEMMTNFSKDFGVNMAALFGPEQLGQLGESAKLLGLSAEQSNTLASNVALSGMSLNDFEQSAFEAAKSVGQANGESVNLGQVMSEMNNVSAELALSLGNNPKAISRATTEAQRLGMSLQRMDDIAGSLLDFESSIQAELEAQLLTGKNINLAKAREFALNNDIENLSKEILNNNALSNTFGQSNRIQQEAMAKALGMSRQELAKSIVIAKMKAKIDDAEIARQQGMSLEQVKQITASEKFNVTLGKLRQSLAPMLDAAIPIIDVLAQGLGIISKAIGSFTNIFTKLKDVFDRDLKGSIERTGDSIGKMMEGPVGKLLSIISGGVITFAGLGAAGLIGKFLLRGMTPLTASYVKMVEGGGGMMDAIFGKSKKGPARDPKTGRFMKAPKLGKLGKLTKLGKFGGATAAISALFDLGGNLLEASQRDDKTAVDALAKTAKENKATLGGAAIGAGIGAFFGGVGAVPGAMIGAGIGGLIDFFSDDVELAKGGIVTQPIKALVGEAGPEAVVPLSKLPEMTGGGLSLEGLNVKFDEMISKLDELTNIKGDVYIDGNKTGQAIFSAATNLS